MAPRKDLHRCLPARTKSMITLPSNRVSSPPLEDPVPQASVVLRTPLELRKRTSKQSKSSTGLDGNLRVGYNTPVNFVDAWNTLFVQNDFLNVYTGEVYPRHLFGLTNFDPPRWDGLTNGAQKSALGFFIAYARSWFFVNTLWSIVS